MFVLVDSRTVFRVFKLYASTFGEAEAEAFEMLEPAVRGDCETLEEYQDLLVQWERYQVTEVLPCEPLAKNKLGVLPVNAGSFKYSEGDIEEVRVTTGSVTVVASKNTPKDTTIKLDFHETPAEPLDG